VIDPFEVELGIWYVLLPGLGRVYLSEPYLQTGWVVICRKCGNNIAAGAGFRFRRERHGRGSTGDGFLCARCVTEKLEIVPFWQFNEAEEYLFQTHTYTRGAISGLCLALAFTLSGTAGILAVIREMLEGRSDRKTNGSR
jgi:hypothetical protein